MCAIATFLHRQQKKAKTKNNNNNKKGWRTAAQGCREWAVRLQLHAYMRSQVNVAPSAPVCRYSVNVATYILFRCRAEIAADYLLLYTSANFRLFELLFYIFFVVFAILQPFGFNVLFIFKFSAANFFISYCQHLCAHSQLKLYPCTYIHTRTYIHICICSCSRQIMSESRSFLVGNFLAAARLPHACVFSCTCRCVCMCCKYN